MCQACEDKADRTRQVVDVLLDAERAAHKLHSGQAQGWNVIRLANTILDCHGNDGYLSHDDVSAIVTEYAIVVQRLLALEEISGLTG